jgi:uncharacterized membrane protein
MSNYNTSSTQPGLFETARYGTLAVIITVAGILLSLVGLGGVSGFASLAGLVLAIMSLVKREQPKWPAIVTLIVSFAGVIIFLIIGVILVGLLGIALL